MTALLVARVVAHVPGVCALWVLHIKPFFLPIGIYLWADGTSGRSYCSINSLPTWYLLQAVNSTSAANVMLLSSGS